jgi:H+-transporting ATPase
MAQRDDATSARSTSAGAHAPADVASGGLSEEEAARRLAADGPNAIPEARQSKLALLASKLWGPVPWLLEAAIVLELVLGNDIQALIIAVLVALDAGLAFREEGGAEEALALLRQRLGVELAHTLVLIIYSNRQNGQRRLER